MKVLIRYIRTKGESEQVEQVSFQGESLKLGRGTDQEIHLPGSGVALSHATLSATSSGFKVSATKGNQCVFQGRLLESFSLEFGQEFAISGHAIKLLDGKDFSVDVVIELHIELDIQERLQDRFKTKVTDLKISKRGWSWILFVSIISIGLVIPLSGVLSPLWMETMRDSALPDDTVWSSGDLHRSHRFMGDNCDQCHVEPFVQVADQQCQSCHGNIEHHIDKNHYGLQAREYAACTDCHKEHSDSFDLDQQSQKICADCHENLEQHGLDSVKYQSATDFETVHPMFKVSLLTPIQELDVIHWVSKRQPLSDDTLKEVSHLKFSHQLHLAKTGLNSPNGKIKLQCQNCHETEPGGNTMLPVQMDKHCQQCHQLNFDPDDPMRTVPHGSAADVIVMLREYYGFRYVYRHLLAQEDISEQEIGALFDVREARRPGQHMDSEKKEKPELNVNTAKAIEELTKQGVRTDALRWAESKAYAAASNLFEKQACQTCHEVTIKKSNDIPWQVKPIRLTKQWFPLATFSHEKHELMQCNDCHQAQQSEYAQDVLMPDINNCRQCHGGEQSRNLIPSSCTECHQYHFESGSIVPDFLQSKVDEGQTKHDE